MNRMMLSTIILPSVLGLAQAGIAVEPKPMNASVVGLAEVALEAGKINASAIAANAAIRPELKETVKAQSLGQPFVDAAMRGGGTIEYAFKGNTPMSSQAPRITKAVEVELSAKELATIPAVDSVVLRAIVDERGIPRNVQVTRSGGSVVDQKAIEALNQYRFTPAMVDNQPTWSTVSVTIKLQK